jgi:hypothetical protein
MSKISKYAFNDKEEATAYADVYSGELMDFDQAFAIASDGFQLYPLVGYAEPFNIPFLYDEEPGLDDFLADVAESQRCTWHGPRGLYHALWEDGLKKMDSQESIDKIKHLIGIELPEGDFELLKEED